MRKRKRVGEKKVRKEGEEEVEVDELLQLK